MKIKSCIRYQLSEYASAVKKYYLIVLLIYSFFTIVSLVFHNGGSLSGVETVSTTFIFILMLASFRDHFNMLKQNGISRKTFFLSTAIVGPIIAFILIIIDIILFSIFNAIIEGNNAMMCMLNCFEQLYPDRVSDSSFFQRTIETILLMGCINTFAMSVGYTIAAIYYRLTKFTKIIFFTSIPVLYIGFFFIDSYMFNGAIIEKIEAAIKFCFGVGTNNPYIPMLTLIIMSVIVFSISWIAIRRAPVKEK